MSAHDAQDSLPEKGLADDWLLEKSEKALETLARLIESVRQDQGITSNSKEGILSSMTEAAWNITIIMSSAAGSSDWSVNDARMLSDHGLAGYRYLAAKYKGRGERYILGWDNYWKHLKSLIEWGYTQRSEIYQMARFTLANDSRFERISEVVESLMMGEVSWDRFIELSVEIGREPINRQVKAK